MTDRLLIGLLLAVAVESARWTRLRWDFSEKGNTRAWQFCALAIGICGTGFWLENRFKALPLLLEWLPVLLLPMQFVQSYGLASSLPLNTFSFFARQRRARNRRLGLQESIVHFNFGNLYFAAVIIASALGGDTYPWLFAPLSIGLTAWLLLGSKRSRPVTLAIAFAIAGGLAMAGQYGIARASDWATQRDSGYGDPPFDPDFNGTAIGRMRKIKQSPDIIWRLKSNGNSSVPALLRTASYNKYQATTWVNAMDRKSIEAKTDFKNLDTLEPVQGQTFYLLRDDNDQRAIRPELPRFFLRGAATANTPLPLPGTAASLRDFELDDIERNSLGTVRVFPKRGVIDGTVLWQDQANPESGPRLQEDLRIPAVERPALAQVSNQLDWHFPTLEMRLAALKSWFARDFKYTRYPAYSTTGAEIRDFLTKDRKGHCEHFATASVLMLRQAGIPARYAIGFSVREKDEGRNEHVVRGIHGHAWCRVWDERSRLWIDFDPTPPDWLQMETRGKKHPLQWLQDGAQRLREDFTIWRNEPRNQLWTTVVMILIGLSLASFVGWRLWRTKRRLEVETSNQGSPGARIRTPLHDLENAARKHIGPRTAGQPFGEWMRGLGPSEYPVLDEAIRLHQRIRFDPSPVSPEALVRLETLADSLNTLLKIRKR